MLAKTCMMIREVTYIVLCVTAFMGTGVQAQFDGQPQTFPLSLRVKEIAVTRVRTGIFLRLNVHDFNMPVSAVFKAISEDDGPEAGLRKFLEAIRNDDVDAFTALTDPELRERGAENLRFYRMIFEGVNDPVVLRRHDLGEMALFDLQINKEHHPTMAVILVRHDNSWFQAWGKLGHPLLQNLAGLSRARRETPERFGPIADRVFPMRIDLPDLFGSTGRGPVQVLLDGHRLSLPVLRMDNDAQSDNRNEIEPPEEVRDEIAIYRESCSSLVTGDIGTYLASFGERSQAKAKERVDHLVRNNVLDREIRKMSVPRRLVFAVVSDELTILFHRSERSSRIQSISHEYVQHVPGGSARRVNYASTSALDMLLTWQPVKEQLLKLLTSSSPASPESEQ